MNKKNSFRTCYLLCFLSYPLATLLTKVIYFLTSLLSYASPWFSVLRADHSLIPLVISINAIALIRAVKVGFSK